MGELIKFASVAFLSVAACTTEASQRTSIPAARESAAANVVREPSNQKINDSYEQQIAERILGREAEPAKQVFKNIQIPQFKDIPASRLLGIMNGGYSRALGVNCTHCHDDQDFASDEKRPKRVAREMAAMHLMINQELRKMQNITTPADDRPINCFTCHRGAINPRETDS